ncbi:hypothetical protein AURDEDRAFT_110351, partial [Auricularia subglabra TFB-10046 SS5]
MPTAPAASESTDLRATSQHSRSRIGPAGPIPLPLSAQACQPSSRVASLSACTARKNTQRRAAAATPEPATTFPVKHVSPQLRIDVRLLVISHARERELHRISADIAI